MGGQPIGTAKVFASLAKTRAVNPLYGIAANCLEQGNYRHRADRTQLANLRVSLQKCAIRQRESTGNSSAFTAK